MDVCIRGSAILWLSSSWKFFVRLLSLQLFGTNYSLSHKVEISERSKTPKTLIEHQIDHLIVNVFSIELIVSFSTCFKFEL